VPWSPAYADENPAGITRSVAVAFAFFGLLAVLFMGVMLGANSGLFRLGNLGGGGGKAAAGPPVTLDVVASEFKLTPSELRMDAPGRLTVNLKNTGAVEHDFTIEGVSGMAYAKAGGSGTGVFDIKREGTYTILCSIPGHKDAGMKGILVVGSGAAAGGATQPAAAAGTHDMAGMPGMPGMAGAPATQPAVAPAVAGAGPLPAPQIAPLLDRSQPATVRVELETEEVSAQLADGVTYKFWTFNGTVPGPMIRVRQGDTVDVVLRNAADSSVTHSIDLHAVTGPGGGAKVMQVPVGGTGEFTFKALQPGVYVYHCATPMVAQHLANGMYGLIVVEPEGGLPKVDREYYVMQGDVYTTGERGQPGNMDLSVRKMLDERPDYVLFNGGVGNLTGDGALQAKVGETVRVFFGDGGPNLTSSFHVIGEIFDRVYPEGSFTSAPETDVQTTLVPAGGATVVEFTVQVPGDYVLVDHSLGRLEKGAAGILHVDGPADPTIFNPVTVGAGGSGGH
jgi:nitrite reductase (NO-forming)